MKAFDATLGVVGAILLLVFFATVPLEFAFWVGGYVGIRERSCIKTCVQHAGTFDACVENCQAFFARINTIERRP